MKVEWKLASYEKPEVYKSVWIYTWQWQRHLAWYLVGKNSAFWPYGFCAVDFPSPFLDKDGESDVRLWAYADMPDEPEDLLDE